LRLGVLVDFLSHPVVVSFTNVAAIIIASSQVGKIFGIGTRKGEHHYEDGLAHYSRLAPNSLYYLSNGNLFYCSKLLLCYIHLMTINILYFASLREKVGRGNDTLDSSEPLQVAQVWQQATGQDSFPDDVLIALNQEYTSADTLVNDGDEVAFFPPVTGG